jgi:hypothetical protein
MFHPRKYYAGLSKTQKQTRRTELTRRASMSWKNPRAYRTFKTDVGVRTKRSGYTAEWKRRFPDVHSLEGAAKATGVPLTYIKESYNRGMAAWRTGHRPGATQQQWGYARVYSFLLKGKTYSTADADLVRDAKNGSASARRWWDEHTSPAT